MKHKFITRSMWIIWKWQHFSPQVTVKGCKSAKYPILDETDDDMSRNGNEEDGYARSEC